MKNLILALLLLGSFPALAQTMSTEAIDKKLEPYANLWIGMGDFVWTFNDDAAAGRALIVDESKGKPMSFILNNLIKSLEKNTLQAYKVPERANFQRLYFNPAVGESKFEFNQTARQYMNSHKLHSMKVREYWVWDSTSARINIHVVAAAPVFVDDKTTWGFNYVFTALNPPGNDNLTPCSVETMEAQRVSTDGSGELRLQGKAGRYANFIREMLMTAARRGIAYRYDKDFWEKQVFWPGDKVINTNNLQKLTTTEVSNMQREGDFIRNGSKPMILKYQGYDAKTGRFQAYLKGFAVENFAMVFWGLTE